jgi:hypothetical protein
MSSYASVTYTAASGRGGVCQRNRNGSRDTAAWLSVAAHATPWVSLVSKGSNLGRLRAAFLAGAILAAPFIAALFRTEAGLVVMAVALCAGAFLLADALGATPGQVHRWLRLGIGVNLVLAATCIALAAWLLLR